MKKIIFIFLFILVVLSPADAKIYKYSLLEMIENSDFIILAEFLEEKVEFKTRLFGAKKHIDPLVNYKVIEVLKGRYHNNILQIDYEKINKESRTKRMYKPKPLPISPIKGETVIFFLKKDLTNFAGFQGKINLKKDIQNYYVTGLREMIDIAAIKDEKQKAKRLISAFYSQNEQLKLMAIETILRHSHLIEEFYKEEFGTILISILENGPAEWKHAAAQELGRKKVKGAFEVLSKHLYDEDQFVRRGCVEGFGDLGDKRAIKLLEEFLQKEKDYYVREQAEVTLENLKRLQE